MSGATIGGVAGAVIGGFVGGPTGAQWGYAIGSAVGGYVDPEKIQGPKLGEMPVQTSQEGAPRPIVFGTPEPFAGNLLMAGPKLIYNVSERSGGKGGGQVVTTQKVAQTYAIRICEGRPEGVACLKAWRDGKLVRDMTGETQIAAENVIFQSISTFYPGDESQLPDGVLEAMPPENGGGLGNVPAHRGTAYMVVFNDDLTPTGGRIPNWTFLMSSTSTVSDNCQEAGLIFHFPLYNATPNGVSDEVVNGYNGIYSPDDTVAAGDNLHLFGIGSVDLQTFNDYMVAYESDYTSDSPFAIAGRSNWTLSCWFKLLDAEDNPSIWRSIACYYGDSQFGHHGWGFVLDGADNLVPTFRVTHPDNSATTLSGGAVGAGTPHFLAATYDESIDGGTIFFYQDGQRVAQVGGMAGSFIYGGEGAVCVGGGFFPFSYGFVGMVQDVKGYDITLSDQQIADRYVQDDGTVREAPDAPGLYVFPNGSTVTFCQPSSSTGSITLAEVIEDLGKRCNLRADQMELEEAEDIEVQGFLVARQMQAQAAIAPLLTTYFADFPEYDQQLHFRQRGGPVVEEFEAGDFLDQNPEDSWGFTSRTELAKKTNLYFSDKTQNYARAMVSYQRESGNVVGGDTAAASEFNIELAIVLGRDEAQQKVNILHKVGWERAQGELVREFPTYRYPHLVPSNPITFDGKRWVIEKLEPAGGRTKMTAFRDRASNYISDAIAGEVLDPSAPVSNLKGPTYLQALNLPRLRTQDNSPGMYLFGTGVTTAWPGAEVYISVDGGLTWQWVATIGQRATMGVLIDDIDHNDEPISVEAWDHRILQSVTSAELAARANAIAITTNGVSEVAQFQYAAEDSNGDWNLSTVQRGLLTTSATSHSSGDSWVMLDSALIFVPISMDYAGLNIQFRAVTRGTPAPNNPILTVLYDPIFTTPSASEFYVSASGEKYFDATNSFYFSEQ